MKLSDHDIDQIVDYANSCFGRSKGYSPAYRKQYFLDDLKAMLRQDSSGWQIDACPACAGTGYKARPLSVAGGI